jgi:hypothetical protein
MKNQSLPMPSWRKMYVAYPATGSTQATNNEITKTAAQIEEPAEFHEFQRKAFMGNYFAGPHCLFDPRLFK